MYDQISTQHGFGCQGTGYYVPHCHIHNIEFIFRSNRPCIKHTHTDTRRTFPLSQCTHTAPFPLIISAISCVLYIIFINWIECMRLCPCVQGTLWTILMVLVFRQHAKLLCANTYTLGRQHQLTSANAKTNKLLFSVKIFYAFTARHLSECTRHAYIDLCTQAHTHTRSSSSTTTYSLRS